MKLHLRTVRWAVLPGWLRGMFNLNDPRWGRSDDKPAEGEKPDPQTPAPDAPDAPPKNNNVRDHKRGPNAGPPDLDELWRDFNRKLAVCLAA